MNLNSIKWLFGIFVLSHVLNGNIVHSQQTPPADLVLTGGKIATMDRSKPVAKAIAVEGDRIIAVGSEAEIKKYIGPETNVIELGGKFVMPGFIEGHAHYVGLGESMMMLNLATAKSWDDVVRQVEQATKEASAGEWIVGRGWHQSKWDHPPLPNVEGYPTAAEIDKVAPNNPVLLTHASGHASFANGYAMRLAGVENDTKNPSGGEVLRDDSGAATGVFRETAAGLVTRVYAKEQRARTDEQKAEYMRRAIELAGKACVENGITSFQDAGSSFETVDSLKKAAREGYLPVRLWVMIRDDVKRMEQRLTHYKLIGYGEEFLTVRGLKLSIDGALGSHGAWMLEPYEDLRTSSGLNTSSLQSAKATAALAIKNDMQFCVHAIGDRANREVLDIFEAAFKENPSRLPRRWRIEHAQHLHPDDIPRFGKLGVIASMQGVHCTSDAIFVPTRLGMRRSQQGAYAWQSLLKSGAVVTNGTDAPVESIDPIPSFYASVTRKLSNGKAFFPEQCMTREEALRSYTIDCAYAAFEETSKGSLVPGKLADIVVLSNDLLECPEEDIKKTKVEMTIVGGKIAYEKK